MSEGPSIGARAGSVSVRAMRWSGRFVRGQVVAYVGGPARARVVILFGCVLGLNSAATSTIGAIAPELERSLHIGNTDIGLLSSVSLLVGAVFVIPVGLIVDRTRRIPMLCVGIVLWSVASFAGGLTGSFDALLLSRVALGGVAATAGPAIASLTGDYFSADERGNIYAYILGGEIAGTAVGFIASSAVASIFSWHVAFIVLALPGFWLARSLWRMVPEPQRGGQSRLHVGAETFTDAGPDDERWETPGGEANVAREAAARRGVRADPKLILREDPDVMSLTSAVRYILSIPTNMLLIIGSALGYFFFSGLQTFAVVFVIGHYHTSQGTATLVLGLLVLGAFVGTLVSGRLTDVMLRHGILEARTWVPAACYFGAAVLLVFGFIESKLTPALWFDVGGAALLLAANPPLDAARLDIMPAKLWGRAESTRTFLRSLAQAVAPLLFGAVSALIAGFTPEQAPVGTHPKTPSADASKGLELTFLIMLISLFAAGWFLLRSRSTYPSDVATAAASQRRADRRPPGPAGAGPDTVTGQTRVL